MARKYGKKAQQSVKRAMHKYKRGELHSGKGRAKVTSREQAIAIGLSKARKKGAKVPKKAASKRTARKTTSARSRTTRSKKR